MHTKRFLVSAFLVSCAAAAQAADWQPASFYVSGGAGRESLYSLTAGVAWPWQWRHETGRAVLTAQTEAFISHWSARDIGGGRASFNQVGVLPVFRYQFPVGLFAEGGIGLSATDKLYVTPTKTFSTRFNFADMIGVGYSFGANGGQELGLRVMHFSNAGIRKPNPGEEFLMLRYAARF